MRYRVLPLLALMPLSLSATVVEEYSCVSSDITVIQFPEDLTAIGEGAFAGSALQSVVIPSCVTSLGDFAFADCRKLRSAAIPEGVKVIPAGMFKGCVALEEVSLPASLEVIEAGAFASTALERIDLSRCTKLHTIGDGCFAMSAELREVLLPDRLTEIGKASFFGCRRLSHIRLPEALATIEECALACASAMSHIDFPPAVSYIGDNAMTFMNSLADIEARRLQSVPATGNEVWHGVEQDKVYLSVTPELYGEFSSAPQWSDFNIVTDITTVTTPVREPQLDITSDGDVVKIMSGTGISEIVICSASGIVMMSRQVYSRDICVDTRLWPAGTYLAAVTTADGCRAVTKFIK